MSWINVILCKVRSRIPHVPRDQERHLTSMFCQACKNVIHLGSLDKSGKTHSVIFVDTLKVCLRPTAVVSEAHVLLRGEDTAPPDSWQERSRPRCVRGGNRCFWGADMGWVQNIFKDGCLGFFLCFSHNIWHGQVTQTHSHPQEQTLLWSGGGCVVIKVSCSSNECIPAPSIQSVLNIRAETAD